MPATDPTDQQAARSLKMSLRMAVARRERPPVELEWFTSLHKHIRCSARLLEAAQAEARALLEFARETWAATQRTEQAREEHLEHAKALPRDLESLRAPNLAAWNGLGRRKKRCRAFEAIGRAFTARRQASTAVPEPQNPPVDLHLLHPASCYVPKRPPTPSGLRDTIRNIPGLVEVAKGPADATQYGFLTPCSPSLPAPPAPTLPAPPDFPHSPQPGEFTVRGCEIDPVMAYVVAQGRYAHSPQQGYSAQEAAVDVYFAEQQFPGALDYLGRLLFPGGVGQWDSMVVSEGLELLVDFVHGWFDLSKRASACAG